MNGKITTISGTMFGGKSDSLITEIRKIIISERPFKVFSPSKDTRVGNESVIESRTGQKYDSIVVENSLEILENVDSDTEYVFLDEAQLFDENLPMSVRLLKSRGMHVVVAGLELDFRGRTFGHFSEIVALADYNMRLTSVCNECKEPDARMVARKIDGEYDFSDSEEAVIDGTIDNVEYEPLCTDCYNKKLDNEMFLYDEVKKEIYSNFCRKFYDRSNQG